MLLGKLQTFSSWWLVCTSTVRAQVGDKDVQEIHKQWMAASLLGPHLLELYVLWWSSHHYPYQNSGHLLVFSVSYLVKKDHSLDMPL